MSKKKKVIICLLLLEGLLLCGMYYLNSSVEQNANTTATISEGYPDGVSKEEMQEAMQREADANYWSFDVNAEPVFKDGASEGFLRIVNPPYNLYPIEVDIRLKEGKEIIFQSGRLDPNHYIGYAKLNKDLEKGNYEAIVEIRAYEQDSDEMFNQATADITIIVEE